LWLWESSELFFEYETKELMKPIVDWIDWVSELLGSLVSWLSLILVLTIIVDVTLRYVFNIAFVATFELEWHLFALIFLLGAAWALKEDRHVRDDVFYQKFTIKQKAWVNLIGFMTLLLPMCFVIVREGAQFTYNSFSVLESSSDPGGLPARYIIKGALPLGFFALGLQCIAEILKNIKTIFIVKIDG
jgi:TRAP-type mannitol/chloroaromatic compound transport system permease small subunit